MILKNHPELYTVIIPVVAVPIMLSVTFFMMGIEVSFK